MLKIIIIKMINKENIVYQVEDIAMIILMEEEVQSKV